MRCCRDTVNWAVEKLNWPLVVGLEIPCRWCPDGVARYDGPEAGWTYTDDLSRRIARMDAEIHSTEFKALAARAKKKA